MRDRFPNFFILGAPKCGTTSLYNWLSQHPQTWMPIKEPNFFSVDILDTRTEQFGFKTRQEYLNRVCSPEPQDLLVGEATPKYLYSNSARAAISEHKDDVRLIVLLRNPIDIAIAMHAQNVRQGREMEPSFSKAWYRGANRPGDKLTDYKFWAQPGVQLQKYLDLFSEDRIRVYVLEEEMRTEPGRVYDDVLEFLGLDPYRPPTFQVHNQRRTYRSVKLQAISRRARRIAYNGLASVGLAPERGTGLIRLIDLLNNNRVDRRAPPMQIRKLVASQVEADTHLIANTLKRDTLPWSEFNWNDEAVRRR